MLRNTHHPKKRFIQVWFVFCLKATIANIRFYLFKCHETLDVLGPSLVFSSSVTEKKSTYLGT